MQGKPKSMTNRMRTGAASCKTCRQLKFSATAHKVLSAKLTKSVTRPQCRRLRITTRFAAISPGPANHNPPTPGSGITATRKPMSHRS